MSYFDSAYGNDDLLRFGLAQLAAGTPTARLLYIAAVPVGALAAFVMAEQDKYEIVQAVWQHPEWNPDVPHQPRTLNWDEIIAAASAQAEANQNNNKYGFFNSYWISRGAASLAANQRRTDRTFIQTFRSAADLDDCRMLMRALGELGAQPLILSQPLKGAYWKDIGVSYAARRTFYLAEQALADAAHVPIFTFADHDDDLLFSVDPFSHLGPKGWAYYDQALDAFYNNRLTPN
jgi:D-alanine transfer protein